MRIRNGEAGQSIVLVAVALTVLIGILGLAVDMGYLRYVRRELQTAADAAAYAGAMDITYGTVSTAGQAAASENGFPNGANGVTVTINNPPQHGPYSGASYPTYVEAIVTQTTVPTFFSRIFGVSNVTLSASSVAAGGNNCIYGLDSTSGHTTLALNAAVVDSTCGVVDNANLGGGLFGFGVGLLCAPSVQVKGTDNLFGGTCGSGFRPARPVKITTAAPDPFASLNPPFVSNPPPTCLVNNNIDTVATDGVTISQVPVFCGGTVITGRQNITVTPGTYWGSPAFKIQDSTVTFQPGTYTIVSKTPGVPALQLNSSVLGRNNVSFGAGTYTFAGGITDVSIAGFLFGSAVNWNNTAGTPSMMIIDGGGLTLIGSSGNGGGSVGQSNGGITFYNTGTAGSGAVTSYGTVRSFFDFSGGFCGAACQISAPTSGQYAGILFFNDRNNTATVACGAGFGSSQAGACFTGNTTFNAGQISHAGAYYFPNTTVGFAFDFGQGAPYSFLVANDINWFFSFTFNRNFTNLPNGSPVKQGSAIIVQ
jgi:hypothetical protein